MDRGDLIRAVNFSTGSAKQLTAIWVLLIAVVGYGSAQPVRLEYGESQRATITPGERSLYQLHIKKGQFVRIDLRQKSGVDVVLSVHAPGRKPAAKTGGYGNVRWIHGDPTLYSMNGFLSLAMVAQVSGLFTVGIDAKNSHIAGGYEIRISELRAAIEEDLRVVEAEKRMESGERLRLFSKDGLTRALVDFGAARAIFREIGDRRGEAAAMQGLGLSYSSMGEKRKAALHLEEALELTRMYGNASDLAILLANIGWSELDDGRFEIGIARAKEGLELAQGSSDRRIEAQLLNNLAHMTGRKANTDAVRREVISMIEQSAAIFRELDSPADELAILYQLAAFCDSVSDKKRAAESYQRGYLIARQIGHRSMIIFGLLRLGENAYDRGDFQQAADYYGEAAEYSRGLGNYYEAYTLYNLGNSSLTFDKKKVLENLTRAMPMWGNNINGEAYTMASIGQYYFTEDRKQDAIEHYLKALQLMKRSGDSYGVGIILSYLGETYASMNKHATAIDFYLRALGNHRASQDRRGEARTLIRLGSVHQSAGDMETAVEYFNTALAKYRSVGNRNGEASALFAIARADRENGHIASARSNIEAALQIVETLRAEIASDELRTAYYSSIQAYYEFYTDILMTLHGKEPERGFDRLALETSERGRARGLLELLAAASVDLREGVDGTLLDREAKLQNRLETLTGEQARSIATGRSRAEVEALERELEDATASLEAARGKINAASPRFRELRQNHPLASAEMQQLLDKDSILFEYKLGEERSFLWVVTRENVRSFILPKRVEIEASARRVYDLLTARNTTKKAETSAQAKERFALADRKFTTESVILAKLLLGKVEPLIQDRRLIFVSDGLLQYIPFGSLPKPGMANLPLALTNEILYLPSASTLAALRKMSRTTNEGNQTVAVIADPVFSPRDVRVKALNPVTTRSDGKSLPRPRIPYSTQRALADFGLGSRIEIPRLPFSRREAESIVTLAGEHTSLKALDFSASWATAARGDLSKYRIVHFATHGLLNSSHPELSGLLFSLVDERGEPQNGFWRLRDIYGMNLSANLVVLSACQTGLGKNVNGEGLVGLTRGFMYAGSPRVVASLWKVDDAATAELMQHFYRLMFQEELRPAAALRSAQSLLRKDPRWSSPFYWAGFTIQGEWR